jgi:hypothetical protein
MKNLEILIAFGELSKKFANELNVKPDELLAILMNTFLSLSLAVKLKSNDLKSIFDVALESYNQGMNENAE